MTELAVYQPQNNLSEVMEYAKAVSVASMLPENYRGKPADIMLAVGLGSSMGLSPAESLYRISVIKGKPTASAELIAANVRKAGHRLRISTDETARSVTATIFRADDPEFPFEVTRDMAWAQSMGLANNDNYKRQALTMLQWRAITAVARLACPEALYGVAYTSDELWDDDRPAATPPPATGADRMAQMLGTSATDKIAEGLVEDVALPGDEPGSPMLNTRSALAKRMFASLNEVGIGDDERIAFCSATIGRTITSSKEMTDADAQLVIDAAVKLRDEPGDDDPTLDPAWGEQ